MGMKNKARLFGLLAMAGLMAGDTYPITGQGNTGSRNSDPKPKKDPTPFNKQDGIVRMIEGYKLIQSGQSKKGKVKQARIVAKIESYLESGALTKDDLK